MPQDLAKDNPYMKMVVNIMKTGNIIDHKVSAVLKNFDITHIQFNILRILEAAMPHKLSAGEINKGLLFPTSDVTRLIDRLEKRDLVSRTLCPENRRKMDISITEKGLQVIDSSLPEVSIALDGFYQNEISPAERDLVLDILKRLTNKKINN